MDRNEGKWKGGEGSGGGCSNKTVGVVLTWILANY